MSDHITRICCVCRDDLDAVNEDPRTILRPKNCPIHLCHRECLLPWLTRDRRCPVCLSECNRVVDGAGTEQSVVALVGPADGVDELNHILQALMLMSAASREIRPPPPDGEPESTEAAVEALMYPLVVMANLQPLEQMFHHSLEQAAAAAPNITIVCGACRGPVDDSRPAGCAIPCSHALHLDCALPALESNGGRCLVPECRMQLAALRNLQDGTIPFHNADVVRGDPDYENIAAVVGLATAEERPAFVCPLCGEARPGLTQVIPSACTHRVHEQCLNDRAGRNPVRNCPVPNCGRQFVHVTRCDR